MHNYANRLRSFVLLLASMKTTDAITKRIEFLCVFLEQGGTLDEMLTYVNRRLKQHDLRTIGLRTLQSTIELLRSGDFDHSLRDLDKKSRMKLFQVHFANKIYTWHPNSKRPQFGDFNETERIMLPFVAATLQKHQAIPSFERVLEMLNEIPGIDEKSLQSASFFTHTGPVLYDGAKNTPQFSQKVILLVNTLMKHIQQCEYIEFHYKSVHKLKDLYSPGTTHRVAPLQIIFYENLYYLVAVEEGKNEPRNFRVDQILRLRVDPVLEADEKTVLTFDAKAMGKLSPAYNHSLGVWFHKKEDPVYKIRIKFMHWAASHILRLKYHGTQTVEEINEEKNYCIVSFKLCLQKEHGSLEDRSKELAFLLGRFRDASELLEVVRT